MFLWSYRWKMLMTGTFITSLLWPLVCIQCIRSSAFNRFLECSFFLFAFLKFCFYLYSLFTSSCLSTWGIICVQYVMLCACCLCTAPSQELLTSLRGKPITKETVKHLRKLLFGSSRGSFNDEWTRQNFTFSSVPGLEYGLVQHKV